MIIDTVVSHGDWFNAWGSFGTPSCTDFLSQCHVMQAFAGFTGAPSSGRPRPLP